MYRIVRGSNSNVVLMTLLFAPVGVEVGMVEQALNVIRKCDGKRRLPRGGVWGVLRSLGRRRLARKRGRRWSITSTGIEALESKRMIGAE